MILFVRLLSLLVALGVVNGIPYPQTPNLSTNWLPSSDTRNLIAENPSDPQGPDDLSNDFDSTLSDNQPVSPSLLLADIQLPPPPYVCEGPTSPACCRQGSSLCGWFDYTSMVCLDSSNWTCCKAMKMMIVGNQVVGVGCTGTKSLPTSQIPRPTTLEGFRPPRQGGSLEAG